MRQDKPGDKNKAGKRTISKTTSISGSLKKLIAEEFATQRECAEILEMSEQQLSRSMKNPSAKFITKLEKAMDKQITVIHGKEIQVIQGEKNNQLKSTQKGIGSCKELIDIYKTLLDEKDSIIADLKEIINNQKEIMRSKKELKGG